MQFPSRSQKKLPEIKDKMSSLCYPFFWHLKVQIFHFQCNSIRSRGLRYSVEIVTKMFHWLGWRWTNERGQNLLQEHVSSMNRWQLWLKLQTAVWPWANDLLSCFLLSSAVLKALEETNILTQETVGLVLIRILWLCLTEERGNLKTRFFTIVIK